MGDMEPERSALSQDREKGVCLSLSVRLCVCRLHRRAVTALILCDPSAATVPRPIDLSNIHFLGRASSETENRKNNK